MSDTETAPDAYGRIQVARHALTGIVRDAYASTQFVKPGSDAGTDEARAGSDHIPNRLIEGLVASVADHLYAWIRASEPPKGETAPMLRIYADYTLWRAILEAAASGIWLLANSDSDERSQGHADDVDDHLPEPQAALLVLLLGRVPHEVTLTSDPRMSVVAPRMVARGVLL